MDATLDTCLKRLRRPVDDLVPFFAVAAGMVILARWILGTQNGGGVHVYGMGALGTLVSDYVVGMALMGPPMLAAFIALWARHGQGFEGMISWAVLIIGFAIWAPFALNAEALNRYGPSFLTPSSNGWVQALILSSFGWGIWLAVRGLLTALRPLPFTLGLWRWGWFAALIPIAFLIAHYSLAALFSLLPLVPALPFDWRTPASIAHFVALGGMAPWVLAWRF